MPWSDNFDIPITLPNGRKARTLRQAATYIFNLPAETAKHPEWQTAMHVLIEAAERRGPITFARMGVLKAITMDEEPRFGPRQRGAGGRRKLVRGK